MRLYHLIFTASCFISFYAYPQYATVKLDLKNSKISINKCRGLLFGTRWSTFTYPQSANKTDSSFVYNQDTIHFQIYRGKKLLFEGLKTPEFHSFDTIRFYRKNQLTRREVWCGQYFADSTGKTSVSPANALYASGDDSKWIYKEYLKNGKKWKTKYKRIDYIEGRGICLRTCVKRKGHRERYRKMKCYE